MYSRNYPKSYYPNVNHGSNRGSHFSIDHYTPDASQMHGESWQSWPSNGGAYRTNHYSMDHSAAFVQNRLQDNRSVCPFHHCIPSLGDQRVGGPHSSHPYGVARHEDLRYDQGYLQEVMSVDVYPNNYAYQTNEPYQTAEAEDRLIGLIRDFVLMRINSRMTEIYKSRIWREVWWPHYSTRDHGGGACWD